MKRILKHKKELCLALALILTILIAFPIDSVMAKNENQASGKKDYIVIAKDNKGYQNQSNKQKDKINKEKSNKKLLKDNNTLVLELSTIEALELSKSSDVLIVEEDIIVTTNLVDFFELEVFNDIEEDDYTPMEQITPWHIQAVKGSKEYLGINAVQPRIRVGILDSGIEIIAEIEVSERINFTGVDDTGAFASMYEDMTGHGTAVAGIIGAADDDTGIVGINPNAEIYSLKVFDDKNQAPLSRIIEAIQYAIDNDIKILNMSFGTTVNSTAMYLKIREAYEAGILLVAAAGNKGILEYPAAYNEVIAVGASTTDNKVADFSPSGVEIIAPGTSILTTSLFGGYTALEGTSLSAPHIVAAASLLWAKDTNKSSDFIRQLLSVSARKIESDNAGSGLLDVANAFEIYEQFEDIYEPSRISYDEIADNYSAIESYEEEYVIGNWDQTGHNTTITDSGYLLDYVAIMKASSYDADHGSYAGVNAQPINIILHGGTVDGATYNATDPSKHTGQNYVSNVRYLYEAACQVYNGNAIPNTTIYTNVSSDLKTITQYIVNKDLGTGSLEKTNEGKAAKILGYAIHMAGDVYAHRTLVPANRTSELSSSNFTSGGTCDLNTLIKKQAFLKTNITGTLCSHYTCLVKGIQAGVIESKDITAWGSNVYEDNTSFLAERFTAATFSVRYIMGRFRTRASFNNSVFLPDLNGVTFGLDLNGLYKFYQETGWATTDIPKGSFSTTTNDYTKYLR